MAQGFLEQATVRSGAHLTTSSPFLIKGDILSSFDKFIFAMSVLLINIVIFVIAMKGRTNINGYFVSNRSLTFFPMVCSMVMSNIGTAQFMGVAGFASRSGVTVYAYELNSMTTVDYLKKRYGSLRIEIYISVLSIGLIIFTKASVELYAIYKVLQTVFTQLGPTSVWLSILTVAVLIPSSGGLRAVVYTNTFQAFYLAVGATFISYFCMITFQSYIELKEKFYEAWPNTTRVHFGDNSTYQYTTCGIPQSTSWHIIRSYKNLELPWPGMIFGITINNMWYWCCDQLIVQTGLGAKNIIHCKYACLCTGYIKILTILFMVLPGLVARIIYTNSVACADPDVCQAICGIRSGCSNMAFPSIFLDMVPPNYRGFVLAAVLACSVSSLASCFNSGSTIFTVNIYRNYRPLASELELVCITKMFLVVMAITSLICVRAVENSPGLYNYIHSLTSIVAPPIMAVYISGIMWDRVTEQNAFISLMGGLLVGLIRFMWEMSRDEVPCGQENSSITPDIIHYFHFLHFAIFLFVLCIVYLVITGIFSEPILMVHLYRLIYWLRHSKLDRVDLAELNAAYKTYVTDRKFENLDINLDELKQEFENEEKAKNRPMTVDQYPPAISVFCCMDPLTSHNIVSNNEIRETNKCQSNIKETMGHAKALNIHAVLLLLVSAVMWGFFS